MIELPRQPARRYAVLGLALFFVGVGVMHFTNVDFFLAIMPPYLPLHLELVYLSGAFEILGGLGVLVARIRARVGWGLVALLIAVYPANIHMALHPEEFSDMSAVALYGRLPVQFIFIAWAYWATRPEPASAA